MVLFKDLTKLSTDLLEKDFPHEKALEVEHRYRGKNPQFTNSASVSPGGVTDASSTVKHQSGDVTAELKVTASGSSTVDLRYEGPHVKGLALGTRFERKNGKAMTDSVEMTSEYRRSEQFHGKLLFQPMTRFYRACAVLGYMGSGTCRVGAELSGKGLELSALKYAVAGTYSRNDPTGHWLFALKTAPHGDKALGKIICNVYGRSNGVSGSPSMPPRLPTELAAEAQHSLVDGKTVLAFGGRWYIGTENRDTQLKAKCTHDAKVSVVLSHRFSENLTAALGTQVDAMNFKEGESLRYGLKLNVTA